MKWLQKFMEGRVGVDQFTVFLLFVAIILQLFLQRLPWPWVVLLAYIPSFIGLARVFSKNKLKRHQENIMFLKYWYPIQSKWTNQYRRFKFKVKDNRQYRYFNCQSCQQKLRVPRKAKRVQVTCPKCRHSFMKETFSSKLKRLTNQFKK